LSAFLGKSFARSPDQGLDHAPHVIKHLGPAAIRT